MQVKNVLKKEREIWHEHFIPGLMAGLLVGLIAAFFEMNGSNIALFASIGASAVILTHKYRHRLTILRTILGSYLLAALVSIIVLKIPMQNSVRLAVVIAATTMTLYSFNVFHPPAISAAMAIVLYDRPLLDLFYVLLVTMVAFIMIRLIIYVVNEHLPMKEFIHEFKEDFT